MSEKGGIYDYEYLLDRALNKLAGRRGSDVIFEVPEASVIIVGNKTVIQNFRQIASVLNRDEELLKRYILKELNVPGSINEAGQLELKGKFNPSAINQIIGIFVNRYVKCATCGSPHTKLMKKGKAFVLRCEACGAETTLPAF